MEAGVCSEELQHTATGTTPEAAVYERHHVYF